MNNLLRWAPIFWAFLISGAANAAPEIKLGTPESYCVTYCYVRVPFTIPSFGATHKIGRVFCDFDIDISAKLPVYNGETRTKNVKTSTIGVFKTEKETAEGDVEISTGIIKDYLKGTKVNSVSCHF